MRSINAFNHRGGVWGGRGSKSINHEGGGEVICLPLLSILVTSGRFTQAKGKWLWSIL